MYCKMCMYLKALSKPTKDELGQHPFAASLNRAVLKSNPNEADLHVEDVDVLQVCMCL